MQIYYEILQNAITNYDSFIKLLQVLAAFGVVTNYDNALLQITVVLQITTLLQITS